MFDDSNLHVLFPRLHVELRRKMDAQHPNNAVRPLNTIIMRAGLHNPKYDFLCELTSANKRALNSSTLLCSEQVSYVLIGGTPNTTETIDLKSFGESSCKTMPAGLKVVPNVETGKVGSPRRKTATCVYHGSTAWATLEPTTTEYTKHSSIVQKVQEPLLKSMLAQKRHGSHSSPDSRPTSQSTAIATCPCGGPMIQNLANGWPPSANRRGTWKLADLVV